MLRYENKFYIREDLLGKLRELLAPFTTLDEYADKQPDKEYTVRSIYFDSPSFECYSTKIDGIKNRYKLRLRGYNLRDEKSKVFLEIKRKYEVPLFKHRAPLPFTDALQLFKGGRPREYVKNVGKFKNAVDDAERFFYHLHNKRMNPVVTVVYEREPYHAKMHDEVNNLRITIDKNLRSCPYPTIDELYEEKHLQYANKGFAILEVKYNRYCPSWVQPILASFRLKQESASKYCMCIDSQPMINPNSRYDTFSFGKWFSHAHLRGTTNTAH